MNEKEKRIRDARTVEANRKGLMGLNGRIGVIVKFIGEPLIDHLGAAGSGGFSVSRSYLSDPYEEGEDIPYSGPEIVEEPTGNEWRTERNYPVQPVSPSVLGYHFDGLSRGMHLEIWHHVENADLKVYYRGYLVFEESAGELQAYAPGEWENLIGKLFEVARAKQKTVLEGQRDERKQEAEVGKGTWLQKMAERWGFR